MNKNVNKQIRAYFVGVSDFEWFWMILTRNGLNGFSNGVNFPVVSAPKQIDVPKQFQIFIWKLKKRNTKKDIWKFQMKWKAPEPTTNSRDAFESIFLTNVLYVGY